jgi:N-acetylglucosamine-6-phosphate deacetylase
VPGARRLGVARALIQGRLVEGDIEVVDEEIGRVGVSPAGVGLAIPGLVDLQVNGYAGVDLGGTDVDGVHHVGCALAADGVLAYCPTIITSPDDAMVRAVRTSGDAERSAPSGAASIIGAHVEGPFLSPARAGVHPPRLLRAPDQRLTDRLLEAGPVSIVTLAPELPGALELVRRLVARDVMVSAGHSDATAAEAAAGFAAGIRATTHTWNGMRPVDRREPGIVGAALVDPSVHVGLIGDHVHVAPEVALMTWRAAAGRVYLVTDAVAAARASDGSYRIGEVTIERRDGRVNDLQGRVGGGTTSLLECVRLAVGTGVALLDAVAAATSVPASLVNRPDLGVIRPGTRADLLIVSDALELRTVVVGGQELARPG